MKVTNKLRSEIAHAIVDSLLRPSFSKECDRKISDLCEEIIIGQIPLPVLSMAKEYPEYVKLDDDVCIKKAGDRVRYYYTKTRIAYPCKDSSHKIDETEEMQMLRATSEEHSAKRADLYDRLYTALMSCTTTKQIIASIPEAEQFIPNEDEKRLIPVQQFAQLRSELSQLAEMRI